VFRALTGPGRARRVNRSGLPQWPIAVGSRSGRRLLLAAARRPYEPELLGMREGPLLDAAARSLRPHANPDVVPVNATGRDPRGLCCADRAGRVVMRAWHAADPAN
jgi:hypothetical protein